MIAAELKRGLRYIAGVTMLVVSIGSPGLALAASVVQMPFEQLVEDSEFAFEGRVVETRSEWNADRSAILTRVRFEVADVIKGGPIGSFEVSFMGGTADGMRMSLSGLRIPDLGERGIYFMESIQRPLPSPVLGWNQGHFRIVDDRMMTSNGRPVTGFEQSGSVLAAFDEDMPSGLRLSDDRTAAVSVVEFKAHVRTILGRRADERREVAR